MPAFLLFRKLNSHPSCLSLIVHPNFLYMELQLKIIGILLIILALVHASFPKQFNWKEELSSLSIIKRQLIYVHTFFIALVLFLIGLLCITSANELIHTNFGKRICLGLAIFWAARLYVQFFGYSSKIWKGKLFETIIHLLFSLFWTYLSVIFILIYLSWYNERQRKKSREQGVFCYASWRIYSDRPVRWSSVVWGD